MGRRFGLFIIEPEQKTDCIFSIFSYNLSKAVSSLDILRNKKFKLLFTSFW